MNLHMIEEHGTNTVKFIITFDDMEFIEAIHTISDSDRLVVKGAQKPDATIADKLLALEIIARRIERK